METEKLLHKRNSFFIVIFGHFLIFSFSLQLKIAKIEAMLWFAVLTFQNKS